MIPVYGFMQGDTLGVLILVEERDTVLTLLEKIKASAAVRVGEWAGGRLVHRGRELQGNMTIRQAGLGALDRVDVVGAIR